MKIFVIASTEYKANMPDLFLMDENGNYYGASENSYPKWHNYPKSIDHWFNAEGSDAGRYFNIDEVEVSEQNVEEFDRLTKEFIKLDKETPQFDKEYPSMFGKWPSKKAYYKAVEEWKAAHDEWCEKSDIRSYNKKKDDLWTKRIALFLTFSQKVTEAISENDYIKYL